MKIPIHEKYMLSTAEAAEYFSIGVKQIRKMLQDHPEMAIWYVNKWMLIRKEAERFFANLPINEEGTRKLR